MYARTSVPIRRIPELELSGEEWIWAQLNINGSSIIICCIYLPPNLPAHRQTEFLDRFSESVTMAQTYLPKSIIILGDINVGNVFLKHPIANSGITSFDQQLKDASNALDLSQLIDEPTRPDSNNLRDLIFVTDSDNITDSGVLPPFSNIDHYPIYVAMDIGKPVPCSGQLKRVWDYDKLDAPKLTNILMNTDWDDILSGDIDEAATKFTATILDAAKSSIPMKNSPTRQHKPWMTTELTRNIRKRDRLFRQARRRQSVTDWDRWKRQRNFVTALNKQTRDEYFKRNVNKLLLHKQSPYKYHTILKKIMGRTGNQSLPPLVQLDGTTVTNDDQKATLLNNHFAKQSQLDVDDNRNPLAHNNRPVPAMEPIEVSPREVLAMLNSLEPNKSCGSDEIPPKILKLTALLIYEPLTKLFNASLSSGMYPEKWKIANIHPIYKKKGSPSDPTNYRPISLLPCMSKLLEKIVFKRIYQHASENSLLCEKQSGYRPGHGTQLQLLHLTQNLFSNLDQGNDFTAIYLDIAKYFDKIWHRGL